MSVLIDIVFSLNVTVIDKKKYEDYQIHIFQSTGGNRSRSLKNNDEYWLKQTHTWCDNIS